MVFSGVIPLSGVPSDPRTHRLWRLAEAHGATIETSIGAHTTHVVAARLGTAKVSSLLVNINVILEGEGQARNVGGMPLRPLMSGCEHARTTEGVAVLATGIIDMKDVFSGAGLCACFLDIVY